MKKGPQVPPVIAGLIICLALGGVGGYYFHFFRAKDKPRPSAPSSQRSKQGTLSPAGGEKGFAPTFDQAITYLWRKEKSHQSTCSDYQAYQFLSVFRMMRAGKGQKGYQQTTTLTLLNDDQIEEMRQMFTEKKDQAGASRGAAKEPDTNAMLDDLIQWFEARLEATGKGKD